MKHKLIEIDYPEFGVVDTPPNIKLSEYQARIAGVRAVMESHGLTHLVIYADREHFTNLFYLSGFDPRFEEALMILRPDEKPLIITGNECGAYLNISPLFREKEVRHERYQSFSLLSQPRNESKMLREIFASEGISEKSKVGCAGWKFFSEEETPDALHTIEIPAFIVDVLREIAGHKSVVNATDIFMHPDYGLRSACTASETAFLEYSSVRASEGVKKMLHGIKDGMVDFELAKLMEYSGEPLCCHMTLVTGDNREYGMCSPMGAVIRRGEPLAFNLGYWGSNVCRAGWVTESHNDLPANVQDYIPAFAGRYYEAMNKWFSLMRIGVTGGGLYNVIAENLPFEEFGVFLNPGHLIHMDEWVSSPVFKGSKFPIRSGMAIQVDVIPSSPVYFSTRMEDGIVIADKTLRREIREMYPDCYKRCQARREFMENVLGIELSEDVLPLSNIPAIVPPFFLRSNIVFAIEK
ncbi:MAG: hypothetical protein ABIH42_08780 [Planctomycetota bacterium]